MVLPLTALLLLWGFVVVFAIGDSMRLVNANTFDSKVVRPTESLISELQNERRMSLAFLADDPFIGRVGFDAQRVRTDQARDRFAAAAKSGDLDGATTEETRQRMRTLVAKLGDLPPVRQNVDNKRVSSPEVLNDYTGLIEAAGAIYDAAYPGEPDIGRDTRTLIGFQTAREHISYEDALITGALARNRPTPGEQSEFARRVGAHRLRYAELAQALPAADRRRLAELVGSPAYRELSALEDQVIAWQAVDIGAWHDRSDAAVKAIDAFKNQIRSRRPGDMEAWREKSEAAVKSIDEIGKFRQQTMERQPVDLGAWHAKSEAAMNAMVDFEDQTRHGISGRAAAHARGVLIRLGLAGGIGLAAVIVSAIVGVRLGRRLVAENREMVHTVENFATKQLPALAGRIQKGEHVDPDADSPPNSFELREISQVYEAFAEARRAVVQATVAEAATRRGLGEVFVNLARRNQVLLQRVLKLLDGMERQAKSPDELAELFTIDHLVTRMRRHAEGLVILAGRSAGRTWNAPVPIVDAVRAAVSEIEQYQRVKVQPMPETHALSGTSAADVIHLLAELIENAVMYSPPGTQVTVTAQTAAHGVAVEVEDRGLGLDPDKMAMLNQTLYEAPDFDLFDSARLGLFVVARLAAKHDIRVLLRASPYGGTTAIVLLPDSMLADPDADTGVEVDAQGPLVQVPLPSLPPELESDRQPLPLEQGGGERPRLQLDPVDESVGTDDDELPQRTRQQNLDPRLRDRQPTAQEAMPVPAAADRPTEQLRSRLSAMQDGWKRGREAAEQERRSGK
ncbi:sensor histidine kinase [Actinomadura barringtoniae]|uniref:histidine kinase n=1 Tax=Actinomadura barringtoniae TaxID=1427535 RepID=A0A939PBQ0_9ACTN|nr:nitrate- and nitrite sensing domain-containing protein [Actinomadura barringtoniae]MBO2446344.1 sensor histidine kinase [Actinomadura barringtoniae]